MTGLAQTLLIRRAGKDDIGAIAALFADDEIGGHGDTLDAAARPAYAAAFDRIAASPNDCLYVAEIEGTVVGTFQMTFVTTMSGRGSTSLMLSAVQTRRDMRGLGIGRAIIRHVIQEARQGGISSIQLTSNNLRLDAHRFYEREGFVKSHAGFKMKL